MKVVKKKRGLVSTGFGGGTREQSPLRPVLVEKKPPCSHTCPAGNRIRECLTTLAQAEKLGRSPEDALARAWAIVTETSPFPAVCGRVCSALCAEQCNRREIEGAVNIHDVERAIGDFGLQHGFKLTRLTAETRPQTIAVVGAGPSGLSCAYQLARRGYRVTVYEATPEAGGALRWGVPAFRLPRAVLDAEIRRILDLGVELRCGVTVGRDITLDELRQRYDAVQVAQGGKPGVAGEDGPNVFSGVDFLTRFHHGERLGLGEGAPVVVVGGGDVAVDAARVGRRLGASVTLLYRRTRAEMPAIAREVDEALQEGVRIEVLAAPVGFRKEGDRVVAVRAIRMELGEPDAAGRRNPAPIAGSEYEIPAAAVISSEGKGWTPAAAVGHGRRAAEAIARTFLGTAPEADPREIIHTDRMQLDHYARAERLEPASLELGERFGAADREVNLGFTREQVFAEAQRCMSCGACFDCEKCWMYCQDQAVEKPVVKGDLDTFKLQNCTGCGKCKDVCPCGFIDMV